MSGETKCNDAGDQELSILSAIETCCQHISDLKIVFNAKLSVLDNHVTSLTATLLKKMDALEYLVKTLPLGENQRHKCCDEMLLRMNVVERLIRSNNKYMNPDKLATGCNEISIKEDNSPVGWDNSVEVITLNAESDYPNGSWLGDEFNVNARVRCKLTPTQLLHINTCSLTPEKMAIALMDYLFPKEVLAESNLSGKGKHGKKQLDPLLIYGIRCHLFYKFNITDKEWFRIKQNMDSKCRSVWKKKVKGLPLANEIAGNSGIQLKKIKKEKRSKEQSSVSESNFEGRGEEEEAAMEVTETAVVYTSEGDIQIVQATEKQMKKLKKSSNVQVFPEHLVLPVLQEGHFLEGGRNVNLTSTTTVPVTVISADGNKSNANFLDTSYISIGEICISQTDQVKTEKV